MDWSPLAASGSPETYTPEQLLAGATDVITKSDTVASGAGVLKIGAVLGRVSASGKLVAHAPAATTGEQTAVAILATPVDATSADKGAVVYVAGEFAMQALVFNAATNTDALKLAVFGDESPIIIKKLGFSAT